MKGYMTGGRTASTLFTTRGRGGRRNLKISIGLYLFNTANDHVNFWHACTLGPGLYSPNVFGDAALINDANLCKICQSVNIMVYTFTFWYTLFYRFISF